MSQVTPPMLPGELQTMDPPAWPKAIGILSIVFACLGLGCGGCGMVQNVINLARGGSEMPGSNGVMIQLPPPSVLSIILGFIAVFWALALLAAGIMTIRRHASGRTLHLLYAGVSIALTALSSVVAVMDMRAMLEAMKQDPQAAQMAGFIEVFMYGALCFGIVLGVGYSGFLLVWFGVMNKRPEASSAQLEPHI